MRYSMTGQEKGDCLIKVTTWAGLTVFNKSVSSKRKFKQWWSTIPQISTKQKITSLLKSLNTKKVYDNVGNPSPGLGQA